MRNTITTAGVRTFLVVVLLICGCGQNRRTSDPLSLPASEHPDRAADIGEASQGIPVQSRDSEQSPPASVVFVAYVATPHDVVSKMLELAGVRQDDVVYDLGCGDGRILVAAAKKYGCRAVGVDLDRLRVAESRANALKNGVADLITVKQMDALKVDLRPATVVTLYLSPT